MRRDLFISILGHLAVVSILIILNPAGGLFPQSLPVMTVSLASGDFLPAGGSVKEVPAEEAAAIAPPPEAGQTIEDITPEERFEPESPEKPAEIIPEKPQEKPKPEKKPEPKKPPQPRKVTETKPADTAPAKETPAPKEDGRGGLDVTGSVGGTGVGAGAGSGTGTFNLPYNIGLVTNRIERAWRNPVTAPTPISCTLYFRIASDGSLMGEPVIERSSGIHVFDQSAVMAVMRAGQFPQFPAAFRYDYIGLHLDFEYVP